MPMFNPTIQAMVMAFVLVPTYAADCCRDSVAVLKSLSGSATVQSPGGHEKVPVSSLDWLSEGMTLEVGPRSQAVLILLNGHQYELREGARLTVKANSGVKMTGAVRELPALPPIPKLAPILVDSGTTSAAVRIRGAADMSDLYPRAGTTALADNVTLRFKAVPEAISYRVVLESYEGDNVLNVLTESTEVPVLSASMKAGAHYYWRVRAMRSGVTVGAGAAEFSTLPAESALQRTEFASALRANSNDPASLALLADVDLRLGLIAEACDEFSAAVKQRPEDVNLQRALDLARARLAGKSK